MKQKKTLSNWLTSRFLVIVRDEENFAEKTTIRFNYARLILLIGTLLILFSGISFLLVTTVLGRWFDPRVEYMQTNRLLIELEEKVDSLELQAAIKERYIKNIKNIMSGNVGEEELTQGIGADVKVSEVNLDEVKPIDSVFRKEFEDVDYDRLSYQNTTRDDLQSVFFFPPINGIVTRGYAVKEKHYGTDIVAKENEPIKSIADGTVVLSSWTQDSGYVIGVQHKNQLISFYKHNSVLLKQVGEIVKAGDIVAIIGNSGEFTDGPHLHLELWYKGNPVDPEDFVAF
ncbi:M23 family metallopeptidase [Rapidithrix thailandica]|uniref:M23 family metallopeptidase n=1 Tax=Rapidithrix thailandica TaxID=413964 RepID=A0AAW9RNL5_9BACT